MKNASRSLICSIALLACTTEVTPTRVSIDGTPPSPEPEPISSLTDERSPVFADTPPPPISGGTLLITKDFEYAVAADPDRDLISVVKLHERRLLHTIALNPGDEPGRVVEDGKGRVHVALRRGGAVVTLEPETGSVTRRVPVCSAPRGLAYDATLDETLVACADGKLVHLSTDGRVSKTVALEVDLRDVVAAPNEVLISRFKSAEILRVSATGDIEQRRTPLTARIPFPANGQSRLNTGLVAPAAAWRTVASPDQSVIAVLHQFASTESIELEQPVVDETEGTHVSSGPEIDPPSVDTSSASPYGALPGTCGSIVHAGLTLATPAGDIIASQPILAPPLTVDAAWSIDGQWLGLVHAGTKDPGAPPEGFFMMPQVSVFAANTIGADSDSCMFPSFASEIQGQPISIAFSPDADDWDSGIWFVVQSREPATLSLFADPAGLHVDVVDLEGQSVADTGHDIFHRDTGGQIACASCHLEGGEDGRVWKFDPIGARRTQTLNVGLTDTAPFHWDGDMADLNALVKEVFVRRMGGPQQRASRIEALASWLGSLAPLPSIEDPTTAAAARGRELFESEAVGCATCHNDAALRSGRSAYVGTTEPGHLMQIPTLVGIGYRAPFLHDGCAGTLVNRFVPTCGGGDDHGRTSHLSSDEIDDLVAYLETL